MIHKNLQQCDEDISKPQYSNNESFIDKQSFNLSTAKRVPHTNNNSGVSPSKY